MRTNFDEDTEAFPAEHYTVRGFSGVACFVLGWETKPDEDTEWSGYEARTGRVLVVMVGDDTRHSVDPEDCTPLAPDAFCRDCGQVGCTSNTYE